MAGAGTYGRLSAPIRLIAGTNDLIEFHEAGGALSADLTGAGTAIDAYWRGDAGAGNDTARIDMAARLAAALTTAGALTYAATLSSAGVLSISANGAFTLNFGAVGTTANPAWFGALAADYASVGNAVTMPGQVTPAWYPESVYVQDSEDRDEVATILTESLSGRIRGQQWGTRVRREILFDALLGRKIFQGEEVRSGESFQRMWRGLADGTEFECTRDLSTLPASAAAWTACRYVMASQEQRSRMPVTLTQNTARRYDVSLRLALYVP